MARTTMCKCVICGKEVPKNTTYFVGNGRACKTHEGVVKQAEERKQSEVNRLSQILSADQREEQEAHQASGSYRHSEITHVRGPVCMVCHKSGVHASEWHQVMLIYMNIKDMMKKGQPISPDGVVTELEKIIKMTPLYALAKDKYPQLRGRISEDMRMVADMLGFFTLCQECCDKHSIDPTAHIKQAMEKMASSAKGVVTLAALGSLVGEAIQERIRAIIAKGN